MPHYSEPEWLRFIDLNDFQVVRQAETFPQERHNWRELPSVSMNAVGGFQRVSTTLTTKTQPRSQYGAITYHNVQNRCLAETGAHRQVGASLQSAGGLQLNPVNGSVQYALQRLASLKSQRPELADKKPMKSHASFANSAIPLQPPSPRARALSTLPLSDRPKRAKRPTENSRKTIERKAKVEPDQKRRRCCNTEKAVAPSSTSAVGKARENVESSLWSALKQWKRDKNVERAAALTVQETTDTNIPEGYQPAVCVVSLLQDHFNIQLKK